MAVRLRYNGSNGSRLSNIRQGDYSTVGGYNNSYDSTKSYSRFRKNGKIPSFGSNEASGRDFTGLTNGNNSIGSVDNTSFFGDMSGAEIGMAGVGLATDLFGAWTQYTGNKAARRQGAKQLRQQQQSLDMQQEDHDFKTNRRKNLQAEVDRRRDAKKNNNNNSRQSIPRFDERGN